LKLVDAFGRLLLEAIQETLEVQLASAVALRQVERVFARFFKDIGSDKLPILVPDVLEIASPVTAHTTCPFVLFVSRDITSKAIS